MGYLKYKGYSAAVRYSYEDKVFWGKLEIEDGLITFEADTAGDFETSFRNAVDEYLEDCRRLGIKPRRATDEPEAICIQDAELSEFA